MRRDAEHFDGRELELVQLSRRLKDALAVEDALSRAGIDYVVEADTYRARLLLIFPTERVGAFFWVPSERAAATRELLAREGFMVVELDDDEAEGRDAPGREAARLAEGRAAS